MKRDESGLRAPNTLIAYLRGDGPTTSLCRLVLRGPCTEVQVERICRALSDGRFFAGAIVDVADASRATCELVAITETLAPPSDARDVEGFIAQLEWAALSGLVPRAGGCLAAQPFSV
jgi:hypothetical protein